MSPATDQSLSALDGATEWINSAPLTAASLSGKVVLVEFWTYSCINWLRSLPYVRAWAEKYEAHGLVTIGVHSPEFVFEHDLANVRRAAEDLRVGYPIVIDNAFAIWRAFGNHYWPALYFVDGLGRTREHHFGEGEYVASERIIQRLLSEAGRGDTGDALVAVEAQGVEAAADWERLHSPESYLGHERAEAFALPGGTVPDTRHVYTAPDSLRLNRWALAGEWTVAAQAVVLHAAGGRIVCRFHARDLHLVMGPAARGAAVPFRVLVDGEPPGAAHGLDIDADGNGTLTEHRLHQLIRQPGFAGERTFEITFLEPGAEAYAFTFG